MRGSEDFIETDFIDQLYPREQISICWPKMKMVLEKQLPPHNLHLKPNQIKHMEMGAGEIWLRNVIFVWNSKFYIFRLRLLLYC